MWIDLLKASVDGNFGECLKESLGAVGYSAKDFAAFCDLPESTLYKIMSNEEKDFRISTLRRIVLGFRKLEGGAKGNVLGVITSRAAIDSLDREIEVNGKKFVIKDYPALSIEEEIIQGIRAEREGVAGLVCGPVAASTLEKVVIIPVVSMRFERGPLVHSLERLAKKV